MRRSDVRTSLPPHSVSFARRYHPLRLCSFLPHVRRRPASLGLCELATPRQLRSGMETTGPPKFLGNLRAYALLSDPGGTDASSHGDAPHAAPVTKKTKAARDYNVFGAQSHGLGTRCLRFARCIATEDARLASRCWPNSTGRVWLTRKVPAKGFRDASYIASSFPKLRLAQFHSFIALQTC